MEEVHEPTNLGVLVCPRHNLDDAPIEKRVDQMFPRDQPVSKHGEPVRHSRHRKILELSKSFHPEQVAAEYQYTRFLNLAHLVHDIFQFISESVSIVCGPQLVFHDDDIDFDFAVESLLDVRVESIRWIFLHLNSGPANDRHKP